MIQNPNKQLEDILEKFERNKNTDKAVYEISELFSSIYSEVTERTSLELEDAIDPDHKLTLDDFKAEFNKKVREIKDSYKEYKP